jgi:hypothetical protein
VDSVEQQLERTVWLRAFLDERPEQKDVSASDPSRRNRRAPVQVVLR